MSDEAEDAVLELGLEGRGCSALPPRKRLFLGFNCRSNNDQDQDHDQGVPLSPTSIGSDALVILSEGTEIEAADRDQRGQDDYCGRCGSIKSVGQQLCSSCVSLCCPYCLVVFDQDQDPSGNWLNCCQCGRFVHWECEYQGISAASGYLCPQCKEIGKEEIDERPCKKLKSGEDEDEEEVDYSTVSPCSSSQLEAKTEIDFGDGSEDGDSSAAINCDDCQVKREFQTPAEAFEVARAAAERANLAAANAKAAAKAKALAAVKAAMLAKNALQKAAIAGGQKSKRHSPSKSKKITQIKLKTPQENDEELARQLHRAMNSSTRRNARKIY